MAAEPGAREPDPDDPRKPDSPTQLTKPSAKFVLRKTAREFTADQCTDIAAALTYYSMLALFPALLVMVSLLGVFGQGKKTTDAILGAIGGLAPGSTMDTIRPIIDQLVNSHAAGFALVAGLLGALWSASGYVGAFGRRSLGNAVGAGQLAVTLWSLLRWPVILVFMIVAVAVLYYATPNVEQPRFQWVSVGSALAIVGWILASLLFGLYVANFSSYNTTYGTLAGVVVFLLWLWITNVALLFGAELDAELERGRELQAGMAAETELQLPPRDTRGLKKDDATRRRFVEDARALRHRRGHAG